MRPLRTFLALALALAAPAARADAPDPGLAEGIAEMKAEIALEQARLQSLDSQSTDLLGQAHAALFGRYSGPQVEASLSTEVQDLEGFGRAAFHGTAITELLNLRITAQVDGAVVQFEFHPSVSPAVVNNEGYGAATDNQDLMAAAPWAGPTPPGILFDRAHLGITWAGEWSNHMDLGFLEFNYSPLVLNGPLYARPDLFDPDPSDGRNSPERTTWRQRFGAVGYQVSADNSDHEFMGLMDELRLPESLTLNVFSGITEYYYLQGNGLHESGARLQENAFKADGTSLSLLFVNRSNDLGELHDLGVVTPEDPINGIQNSSATSLQFSQILGSSLFQSEVAYAFENDPVQTAQGLAAQAGYGLPFGPLHLGVEGGYTAPDYIVLAGAQNVTAMNDVSEERFANAPMLYDTVVSNPTSPMNNTADWGANADLRLGFMTVSARLLDHSQLEASSPVIQSSHFLNGSNVTGGGWWALFNNNYAVWSPSPLPTANASANLSQYNQLYLPLAGGETDPQGRAYATAYHTLEADEWRTDAERLLTSSPNGQPLLPSRKDVAYANCDVHLNLGDGFRLNREVYLDLFQDFESVDDAALAVPDMDSDNLFNQGVSQALLVYGFFPTLYYLLDFGYETWQGNRFTDAYVDAVDGSTRSARLEYYETSAGLGFDWQISPNKVKAMMRVKVFTHADAANGENDFTARQMLWELQAWF